METSGKLMGGLGLGKKNKKNSKQSNKKFDFKKDQVIPSGHQTSWFEDVDSMLTIENSFYILKNADISAGFTVTLTPDEILTAPQYDDLINTFLRVVSSILPSGLIFHTAKIHVEGVNAIPQEVEGKGFVTRKIMSYHKDRPVQKVTMDLYVCFPKIESNKKLPSNTLFSSFKKIFPPNIFKDIDERKSQANEVLKSLINAIDNLYDVKFTRKTNKELYISRIQYLNLIFDRIPNGIENEFENNDGYFKVGDKYVTTVYLAQPGNEIYASKPNIRGIESHFTYSLGSLIPGNHIINTSIKILDTESVVKRLTTREKQIRSLNTLGNRGNITAADNLYQFIEDVNQTQSKIVEISHNVMIWHHDLSKLKSIQDEVMAAYGSMSGCMANKASMGHANYFFTYSPGCASDMFDSLLMPAEQALCFLNFTEMTKGDGQGMILSNRNYELIYVDLWHPKLPSKNRLILGPSGSGKSFFGNNIIVQSFEAGNHIILIDIGGSYRNIVDMYEGKYIELDPLNPIAINPFLTAKDRNGKYILDTDKVTFLRTLIAVMWKDTDSTSNSSLSKEEQAILDEYIEMYYKALNEYNEEQVSEINKKVPILGDFMKFVNGYHEEHYELDLKYQYKMDEFFSMPSFSLVMEKFISGQYASIFNDPKGTELSDNPLTCFDLSKIKGDPVMYPIISLLLMDLVLTKIDKVKDFARIELILDEFFELLVGEIGQFTEKMFRQIRKMNGAATVLTQSVIELTQSPVAAAIVANAPIKILLKHKPELFDLTQEVLGLTNEQMDLLKSLRSEKGRREAFVDRDGDSHVYVVDVGPHAAKVYSTDGKDRAKMKEYSEMYNSKELIINQMVADEEAKNAE